MKLKNGFDTRHLLSMLEAALSREKEMWRPRVYIDQQESENRNQAVRWLAHLTKKFHFLPETYVLAVDLVDRLLLVVKARSRLLKVIGITCFYLAAKTIQEDDTIPATLELVRESECGCSVAEVHRMERVILDKLGWDLRAASALNFMQIFHSLLLSNSPTLLQGFAQMTPARQMSLLAQKLQLCLTYHGLMAFSPSTLALALLSLELEIFHTQWFSYTVALESLAKVNNDNLMLCREKLNLFLASQPQLPKSPYHKSSPSATIEAPKASKRKVVDMEEDEDVYDAIKRLYNDDDVCALTQSSSCASEMSQELCATAALTGPAQVLTVQ